jgi:hypothetical protein
MLKKLLITFLAVGAATALVFGAVSPAQAGNTEPAAVAGRGGPGSGVENRPANLGASAGYAGAGLAAPDVSTIDADTLSADEAAGLLYMREEEKFAGDVYLAMYEKWGQQIFKNIAASEDTHAAAIAELISAYGLEDPSANLAAGEFTNRDLQVLYDQLVAQGSQSLDEALKVGVRIEELDISDLQARIAQSDDVVIRTVYQNLLAGSNNHLRAFSTTLALTSGEAYQSQATTGAARGLGGWSGGQRTRSGRR